VNDVVADVRPLAVAWTVTGPAFVPLTGSVASPFTAFTVAGSPVMVPEPDVWLTVIAAELEVTVPPFASSTATVRLRVLPEDSGLVGLVNPRCVATGSTVKELVSEARPKADAVIVTEPAVAPVTVFDAMPALAVAVPSPVTEPVPEVCPKVTTVELSEVSRLLFASRTSTVNDFVAPDATELVEDVKTSLLAAPGVTLNELVSDVSPDADAVIVTDPAAAPVTVFDATPAEAVAVPAPVTEPAPAVCPKVTTVELSEVSRLLFASRTSTVNDFVAPDATELVDDV
jgi:hypothetical protein